MNSWEDDEDFDQPSIIIPPVPTPKAHWEDEEDIEGWDDEEPQEKTPEPSAVDIVEAPVENRENNWRTLNAPKPWSKQEPPKIVVQPKPNLVPPPQQEPPKPKKVPKYLAKREMAMKEEQETEKDIVAPLTSQDIQKLKKEGEEKAKEADLINAKDLFDGVGETVVGVKYLSEKEKNDQVLRNFEPKTDKDFLILAKAIATRMDKYTNSTHYKYFIKELAKQLMEPLSTEDLSSVVNGINALINDKLKATKGKKGKKVVAPKMKLNVTKGTDSWDLTGKEVVSGGGVDNDDYDFM